MISNDIHTVNNVLKCVMSNVLTWHSKPPMKSINVRFSSNGSSLNWIVNWNFNPGHVLILYILLYYIRLRWPPFIFTLSQIFFSSPITPSWASRKALRFTITTLCLEANCMGAGPFYTFHPEKPRWFCCLFLNHRIIATLGTSYLFCIYLPFIFSPVFIPRSLSASFQLFWETLIHCLKIRLFTPSKVTWGSHFPVHNK